jgi:hypothetical protein
MIIPDTPLYRSKTDAEFRLRMIHHIKQQYKDILGPHINLLDLPNGLDLVQEKVKQMLFESSHGEIDMRSPEVGKLAA